jgi:mannose-1-phosphate guanylyltransferase
VALALRLDVENRPLLAYTSQVSGDRKMYALVLAGGTGTRLWPYSRRARPKQLLPLLGGETMVQSTVGRLAPLIPPERVIVLTNREHVAEVRAQLPAVPAEQIVGEPEPLGTAPAIALGAAIVRARFGEGLVACLPADHSIEPAAALLATLQVGAAAAAQGYIVTIGIPPTGPATGFGYIRLGDELSSAPGTFRVREFVEKPAPERAVEFVASGDYLWNAGMFLWDLETIRTAFQGLLPTLGRQLDEMTAIVGDETFEAELAKIWSQVEDRTTVDYGIIERASDVACVPARFGWDDVGSWSALAALLSTGDDGNVVVGGEAHSATGGEHFDVGNSRGCVVFAKGGRTVATVGLDNVVIVDTPDVVLVCPRERAEEVRELVRLLEQRGRDALL